MTKRSPRGIRNNNPGNIRKNGIKWQGLAAEQPDAEFVAFEHAKWGIRAIARVLITYQDRHDINTVRRIINRWAPAAGDRNGPAPGGEYAQNTEAYVRTVADKVGVEPDVQLNVHLYDTMYKLVRAIIWHENGQDPYDKVTVDAGLRLAGVEPPMKPLSESRTMQGSAIALVGGATITVTSVAEQLVPLVEQMQVLAPLVQSLASVDPMILAIVGIVATLGGAYAMLARYLDHRLGVH